MRTSLIALMRTIEIGIMSTLMIVTRVLTIIDKLEGESIEDSRYMAKMGAGARKWELLMLNKDRKHNLLTILIMLIIGSRSLNIE